MDTNEQRLNHIRDNIAGIMDKIDVTAKKVGRTSDSIKVVGVTKNRSVQEIETAIKSGITDIGENRIQEAEKKIPKITGHYEAFHFIGHLQSNKINKLMTLNPAFIHSIDSIQTAEKLNRYLEQQDKVQSVLVQVNCSGEESKYGLADDYALIEDFVCKLNRFKSINLKGLMTIAAFTNDERKIRLCFIKLREHFELLNRQGVVVEPMNILSMGMSNDYLIAIEEGSNMVRIGSSIFE